MALENPTEFLTTFAKGFIGQTPVYSLGKQIGYYRRNTQGDKELCGGTIFLYKGVAKSDPKTWYTKDAMWRDVPVTQWCLQNGIKPTWLTVEQSAAAIQAPTGAIVVPGVNDSTAKAGALGLPVIVASGAAALAVLLLLVRR